MLLDTPTIVVRPPSPRLADGEVTHLERQPVDAGLAARQWSDYVACFRDAGWDVIELPALAEHPDGVFVEDVVVVYGDLAVVCRPGAASRAAEIDGVGERFAALGYRVATVDGPGTLDGGDVLKVGSTIYVGVSARSDADGRRRFAELLEAEGARVVEVPVTAALHLKSCLTALPDGTIVGHEPLVDDPAMFDRLELVPEESGAHVVDLGGGCILVAADCPATVERYTARGYDVRTVDVSEFAKLEGCVTCLSIRLHTGID